MIFRPMPGFTLFIAACVGLSFALCAWQVRRLIWKQGLLQQIERRAEQGPISLSRALDKYRLDGDVEYLRVAVKGRFFHELERHLFMAKDGMVGWNIVTPFKTKSGVTLFVDRGFVPNKLRQRMTRRAGVSGAIQQISGLVRVPRKANFFTPDSNPAKNEWYWYDLPDMAASIGLKMTGSVAPFILTVETAAKGGWPRGGATRKKIPNHHLEYALTWAGLGLTLIVMYVMVHFRTGRFKF